MTFETVITFLKIEIITLILMAFLFMFLLFFVAVVVLLVIVFVIILSVHVGWCGFDNNNDHGHHFTKSQFRMRPIERKYGNAGEGDTQD